MQSNPIIAGMRIGLLSAWTSRLGGGVFEAVVAQAALIRKWGGVPIVFGLRDDLTEQDAGRFDGHPAQALRRIGPTQIGYAPGLTKALIAADLDCLHLHGIWSYPSLAALTWTRTVRRPLIVSPHGMLDPWIVRRGRTKKLLARMAYEHASWRTAAALHALTEKEGVEIEAQTGRLAELIIPNAAPPAEIGPTSLSEPEALYIGRVHPKKNIAALIEAWRIARRPASSRLTIAGWGAEADVAALQCLVTAAGPSVRYVGAVYGADKQDLIRRSRFVVLPSHGEGLPMAILEGWSAAVPAIMTPQCNLPVGFSAGAAIECGTSVPTIAAALERAFSYDRAQWLDMSAAARSLAAGQFSARAVGQRWAEAYRRIVFSGEARSK